MTGGGATGLGNGYDMDIIGDMGAVAWIFFSGLDNSWEFGVCGRIGIPRS